MSGTKYCIICGKTINTSRFFCSSSCANISYIFHTDDNINSIDGFCNDCSKPLPLVKNNIGRYQPRHFDCNSITNDIATEKVNINDNFEIKNISDSVNISSAFPDNSSTSNSVSQESISSSPSKDAEIKNVESDNPLIVKRKSYYHNLKATVDDFNDYDDVLKYLPDFYLLICNIVRGKRSSWYTKMLANAALSYLVIEDDLIPDKKGAKGYIDDLFLCAYVLREIRDKVSKHVILENLGELEYGDEIFQIIYDVVNMTSQYLEDDTEKILKFVGLNKFTLFDFVYEKEMSTKLKNRKEKKKLFYAMIAVKAKQILESDNNDSQTVALRSLINDHYEFIEISTYMRFLDAGQ